jgi:hypothetical protein
MDQQKPSVGRIVHYVSYGTPGGEFTSQCRAAIVTEVCAPGTLPDTQDGVEVDSDTQLVSLCVLNPTGIFLNQRLSQDETGHTGGTWHWPERV